MSAVKISAGKNWIFMERKFLHIDVNNAFLSWTAVDRLKKGDKVDLRTIPAVIGGDEAKRHGIVVAKSNIAKKFGITVNEIKSLNNLTSNNLFIGQQLKIKEVS